MVPFHIQILTNFTYHVSKNQFSRVTNLTCLSKGAKPEPKHSQQYWIKIFAFYFTIAASSTFSCHCSLDCRWDNLVPRALFPREKCPGDEAVSEAILKGINE